MSAAEAPKSEQIQANVAAALSRLRGELGAASSPVATPTPIPVPKTQSEPLAPETMPANLGPLPAGPVRMPEVERPTAVVRPFEPTLNAAVGNVPDNDSEPVAPALMPAPEEAPKPDLFGRLRADPSLSTDRANATAEPKPDNQPDLLSGMEVPPAPPPPLGSFSAEDEVNGRGRRMRNRLLVLVALVVIGGGAAWAWVSSHQAPEGPAPIITADTTPEKVKPTDEGGMQVPNQNVQILDNMNGQSTTGQQETVLPPPEQPVAPPSTETTDQANAAPQAPAITDAPAEPTPTPAPATTDQSAAPSVSAPAIPSVTAPDPAQTAAAPTPEPQTAAPAAPAAAEPTPTPAPAAAATPAPEPAPAAPKAEPTQTATAPAAASATPSVAPTAGGTARVQLAAVKSEAIASSQWAKMQKAHPDLLGALTLNTEKVVKSDGSTLFRVQAGPLSKAQAKDLCVKLKAAKQDCIVAK